MNTHTEAAHSVQSLTCTVRSITLWLLQVIGDPLRHVNLGGCPNSYSVLPKILVYDEQQETVLIITNSNLPVLGIFQNSVKVFWNVIGETNIRHSDNTEANVGKVCGQLTLVVFYKCWWPTLKHAFSSADATKSRTAPVFTDPAYIGAAYNSIIRSIYSDNCKNSTDLLALVDELRHRCPSQKLAHMWTLCQFWFSPPICKSVAQCLQTTSP